MHQSANELKALLIKAGLGVDLPVGISEDFAQTALWLQSSELPGLTWALCALRALDDGASSRGFPILADLDKESGSESKRVSAIYLATQLSDAVQVGGLLDGPGRTLFGIDYPELVAAALALTHRDAGLAFGIEARTKYWSFLSRIHGQGLYVRAIDESADRADAVEGALNLSMASEAIFRSIVGSGDVLTDSRGGRPSSGREGVVAATEEIQALRAFSSRLLVPESDQSLRFGAGAGTRDAD